MPYYTVQQGDCISSLARQYNLLPDTIWNAGENAALKEQRQSPNVLFPGDSLFIPDLTPKQIPCATDAEYKFIRIGARCKLRVRFRLLDPDGKVTELSNEAFLLDIDRKTIRGSTDGSGGIRQSVDPFSLGGSITIRGRKFPFSMGALDPHDTLTGVQARLNQCGYDAGPIDGEMSPQLQAAINKFQKDQGIPVNTGDPDSDTTGALLQTYGA